MSHKKIIIATIIFLLISSIYMDYRETLQENLNYQKNWWSASFDDPTGNNLSFTIANHSSNTKFHWEVSSNEKTLVSGNVSLAKGNQKDIELNTANLGNSRMTVTITADDHTQEELNKTLK